MHDIFFTEMYAVVTRWVTSPLPQGTCRYVTQYTDITIIVTRLRRELKFDVRAFCDFVLGTPRFFYSCARRLAKPTGHSGRGSWGLHTLYVQCVSVTCLLTITIVCMCHCVTIMSCSEIT